MLDSLSQLGEFLGGIGALVALVYLAIQIRQSNAIARAQSRRGTRAPISGSLACWRGG